MAASGGNLADEFEASFQNCLAALTSQEHFNVNDQEEVSTSVEQSIQKFLDIAKQLETFFLQKRMILSIHRPEQVIKEDTDFLQGELQRKEALLQRQYERLQEWQALLSRAQPTGAQGIQANQAQQSTGAAGGQQGAAQPQQQQQQQQGQGQTGQQKGGQHSSGPQGGGSGPSPHTPPTSQPMPPPPGIGASPLAFLEQTTSNIGLPERR